MEPSVDNNIKINMNNNSCHGIMLIRLCFLLSVRIINNICFTIVDFILFRLFGFITRSRNESGAPSFACHVFEGNTSAEEVS